MIKERDCYFCNDLEGHSQNVVKIYPEYAGSGLIVAESPNLIAALDLHPIVDDPHYLLITRKHYQAFSQLPIAYAQEMEDLTRYLISQSDRTSFLIFEHGEKEGISRAQTVDHAHTHLILTDTHLLDKIEVELDELKLHPRYIQFDCLDTIRKLSSLIENESYLMFRQNEYGLLVIENPGMTIISQFFRVLTSALVNQNLPFSDWKNLTEDSLRLIQQRLVQRSSEIKR